MTKEITAAELSAIERLLAVKTTLEAFGYSFESITVSEAFQLGDKIVSAINESLKECGNEKLITDSNK